MNNEQVGIIEYDARINTGKLKSDSKEVEKIADNTGKTIGDSIEKGTTQADDAFQKFSSRAKVAGAVAGTALAAGIAAAAKASFDQVDAVQQATVGLRAYESDAGKVNGVLKDLISYARSDLGVLFNRKDLFQSAQSLKIMGDNTDDLVGHVQILSRSVGLGLSTFDDLNRIVGRVGSTGRLTGDDFDNLTKAGFKLDDSLRNTDITFESLFKQLDKGIPANALEGQANTIRGASIRLQTAFRGVGDAILGVDSNTSQFIKGGLGSTFVSGISGASSALKTFANIIREPGPVIIGLTAALTTFAVVQTTTTNATKALAIAQGALNAVMRLNPLTLVAAGAIGLVAAYAAVVGQSDSTKAATDRLKSARDALTFATDTAKNAEDRLRTSQLDAEGAALRVESAQVQYNSALAQYGPNSLQAREAAYNLKRAQDDLANANNNVKNSANEAVAAQNEVVKQKEAVKSALNETANSALSVAGSYKQIGQAIKEAREEDRKTGVLGVGKNEVNATFGIPKRATGGPVSANQPYLVGENRDGSINRTSELFVPSSAGNIINSKDLQNALSSGGGGSSSEVTIGSIVLSSNVDVDNFFNRLTRDSEIYEKTIVPKRSLA